MINHTKIFNRFYLFILPLFLFLSVFAFPVSSHFSGGGSSWGDWHDTSVCVPAQECGTNEGTKTQSRTCRSGGDGYSCQLAKEECQYSCPEVTWSTSKSSCPVGYPHVSQHHQGYCYQGSKPDWPGDYSQKVTTNFGPITFSYIKSEDKNKCHRPTSSSLNVPSWASDDYNHDNPELKDLKSVCTPIPAETQTRTKSCKVPFVTCPNTTPGVTPVITPEVTPSPEPSPEVTPTPDPEVTPTFTPTSTPFPAVGGGDNGGGGGNPPGAPECHDADPGIPGNLTATALGGGQVRLNWSAAPGTVTTYAVAYGPTEGNYLYGDPNVGVVTQYTVKSLNPGGNYCFYVQAQNGCRGGNPSNVICTNQGATSLRVLGATDNYNPLVTGIKESYGGAVLGATTELMATAEVNYSSDKLPSGNTLNTSKTISIPSIKLTEAIYVPQKIGDQFVVGHHEVLNDNINGSDVFYGHNGTDVFGSLYKLNQNDTVKVTQDGRETEYKVTELLFVHKSAVDSLQTTDGQIVLTTCSYTQPDYRLVIKASPIL